MARLQDDILSKTARPNLIPRLTHTHTHQKQRSFPDTADQPRPGFRMAPRHGADAFGELVAWVTEHAERTAELGGASTLQR